MAESESVSKMTTRNSDSSSSSTTTSDSRRVQLRDQGDESTRTSSWSLPLLTVKKQYII